MEVDLGEPSTIKEIGTKTNIVSKTETDIVIEIKSKLEPTLSPKSRLSSKPKLILSP
jgi:hypothetical protein